MTLALEQYGVESLVVVEVNWANAGGSFIRKYAERAIPAITASGALLSFVNVSKQAKITGTGGVSKSASVVLDDTDGSLKILLDTKQLSGSTCKIYQYFTGSQVTPINQLLMSGTVASDITWSEGERSLSFGVEEGSRTGKSREIGYAPEENAYTLFNNSMVGKNWPLVFGTAVKVPAVRVEYKGELTLATTCNFDSPTMDIANGAELPQGVPIRIEIDRIVFEGTMAGEVFTPTARNLARYANVPFLPRESGDVNPAVAFVDASIKLRGLFVIIYHSSGGWMVNKCTAQTGTKVSFAKSWNTLLDDNESISEAARWPRVGWEETYETFSDNNDLIIKIAKDGWTIGQGAKVVYIPDPEPTYSDRYICNLIPSSAILEVWGRRKYFDKDIWAKIPSSYYTKNLSTPITTEPGSVIRNVTTIDFAVALSDMECEGWYDEVYVTLTSSVAGTPKAITEWVIANFTTFAAGTIDTVPVTMNFAYFETADAIDFLEQIAWQCASILTIQDNTIGLKHLPSATPPPASITTIDANIAIMKTLQIKTTIIEDLDTKIKSSYVIDYSGLPTSSKLYVKDTNAVTFGNQIREQDFFALTCPAAVQAVTDFWAHRVGNSWKTCTVDCIIDMSDINVLDIVTVDLPNHVNNLQGTVISVSHNTDAPSVSVEIELACKVGSTAQDEDYWVFGPAICPAATGTEIDYEVPWDDSCPGYSVGGQEEGPVLYVKLAKPFPPARITRWSSFAVNLRIVDGDNDLMEITAIMKTIKVYTSNPRDSIVVIRDAMFMAGEYNFTLRLRGGRFWGTLHVSVEPWNTAIVGGNVTEIKP